MTTEELFIWRNINDQFGKEGIKFFIYANDIKEKVNIYEVLHEQNITNNKEIFQYLKLQVNALVYDPNPTLQEFYKYSKQYGYNKTVRERIINDLLPKAKKFDYLPDISFGLPDGFKFKKLPSGDILTLFVGKMTSCCQFIGGDSQQCVIDSFTRPDTAIYVITDKNDRIKAQSYAWLGKDAKGNKVLMLDSFEHLPEAKKFFIPAMVKFLDKLEGTEFKALFVGNGGNTPFLNCEKTEITPIDNDLFQYGDSKYSYKITKDITLYENNYDLSASLPYVSFKNFEEFENSNKVLIRNKFLSTHFEDVKDLDKYFLDQFEECAAVILKLTENNFLSFDDAFEIFIIDKEKREVPLLWGNYKGVSNEVRFKILFKILEQTRNISDPMAFAVELMKPLKFNPTFLERLGEQFFNNFFEKYNDNFNLGLKILGNLSLISLNIIIKIGSNIALEVASTYETLPKIFTDFNILNKEEILSKTFDKYRDNIDIWLGEAEKLSKLPYETINKIGYDTALILIRNAHNVPLFQDLQVGEAVMMSFLEKYSNNLELATTIQNKLEKETNIIDFIFYENYDPELELFDNIMNHISLIGDQA